MELESPASSFLIKYHRGGVFVRNPLSYDYEMLSEIPNVDLVSLGLPRFIKFLQSEFTSSVKSLFYLVPGLDFHLGLKAIKSDSDFDECVQCGVNNDHVLHIYASHEEFELNATTGDDNVGENDEPSDSGSDLEDGDFNVYDYCSETESDAASIDHLSEDEEEVLATRTKKRAPAPKKKASKMFDENFLTNVFNGLPRDDFVEKDSVHVDPRDDEDRLGDHWPIHDPEIKWKSMRPQCMCSLHNPYYLKHLQIICKLINFITYLKHLQSIHFNGYKRQHS